jgi:hypothetical protein
MCGNRKFWPEGDERLRWDTRPIVALIIGVGCLAAKTNLQPRGRIAIKPITLLSSVDIAVKPLAAAVVPSAIAIRRPHLIVEIVLAVIKWGRIKKPLRRALAVGRIGIDVNSQDRVAALNEGPLSERCLRAIRSGLTPQALASPNLLSI